MSHYIEKHPSYVATVAVGRWLRVMNDAANPGQVVVADETTTTWLGTTIDPALTAGDRVAVSANGNDEPVKPFIADTAVAVGEVICAGPAGKVTTLAAATIGDAIIGVAVTACAADGDVVSVHQTPGAGLKT